MEKQSCWTHVGRRGNGCKQKKNRHMKWDRIVVIEVILEGSKGVGRCTFLGNVGEIKSSFLASMSQADVNDTLDF